MLVGFSLLVFVFTEYALVVRCSGEDVVTTAECQCVGQRYFCPASPSQQNRHCIDYSVDDPDSGLPQCRYVWQFKRRVINFGTELSSCFETRSCLDGNETFLCICKDRNLNKLSSVTSRAMTTCHFFHQDQPYQFLDCICKSFHSEQKQRNENVENSQKIVLVLLILLFISMVSLACIITCYTYSTRPPRIPFGEDDEY